MGLEICNPLVVEHLLGSGALPGVDREALADEIARSLRDACPVLLGLKLVVAARDRARFLLGRVAIEGSVPTQEEVGDHAHGPDIDGFPVPGCRRWLGAQYGGRKGKLIRTSFEDLRSHVPGRATYFGEHGQFVVVHNAT